MASWTLFPELPPERAAKGMRNGSGLELEVPEFGTFLTRAFEGDGLGLVGVHVEGVVNWGSGIVGHIARLAARTTTSRRYHPILQRP